MRPYYEDGVVTIYHGDCRDVLPLIYDHPWGAGECVVIDPPWDLQDDLLGWIADTMSNEYESLLFFTDSRYADRPFSLLGAPAWIFVWDTLNQWTLGPRYPVQQTKLAFWYGDSYDRDAALWGDAPPERDHPSTRQNPLAGRRLTDLYRESIRWLHNPEAGSGSAGAERFGKRQSDGAMRHAKPLAWVRCLIGNTSFGSVIDPFMGSGTSLRASKDLGRPAVGIEIEERYCEIAAKRMAQGSLFG
jgi:site-specific DNA-methyltransferase (adenine-specific)